MRNNQKTKLPRTKIKKVYNTDDCRAAYEFRYYAEVEKHFMWFTWWSTADWSYSEVSAKDIIDFYLAELSRNKSGVVEYIDYL